MTIRPVDSRVRIAVSALLTLCGFMGCEGWGVDKYPQPAEPESYQILDQNWTPDERRDFYFTTQGSQILPYEWFLALEQADSSTLVRDDANMLRLGYLIEGKDPRWNPDGLPIGFARDEGRDRAWLGLTCAACHTTRIEYKGIAYRIDGGAAQADVRGFLIQLTDALKATRDRDDKFLRFSKNVLGPRSTRNDREHLRAELTVMITQREAYNTRNFSNTALPLYGRVDALGAILNEVFHHVVKPPVTSVTSNTSPATAPVSYPVLWDTPMHDVVQWNGAVKNAGLGALGRNVGEVLGVFGKFEVDRAAKLPGYSSTVKVRNLLSLEDSVRKLWSPRWLAAFGEIDPQIRDAGRKAFLKANCNACHHDIDRTDPSRRVEAVMRAVGTDELTAANFDKRIGDSGILEGAYLSVVGSPLLGSAKFKDKANGDDMLSHLVLGTILGSPYPAPEDALSQIAFKRRSPRIVADAGPTSGGGIYKARPLNGVWASAPYLHNGSVPTLSDLLLPAAKRPRSFTVGSPEFDPVRVGFRTDAPGYPIFWARTEDGRAVPGNSNEGHEFGVEGVLDDDERRALLEYLKSL